MFTGCGSQNRSVNVPHGQENKIMMTFSCIISAEPLIA
jgi:hypothetical protein